MTKMLDKSRPAMECIPITKSGCVFIQDWIMYDSQGYPLPDDKQEHRDKQAAIVPPAVPAAKDDNTDVPVGSGPIDPDQPFFSLKKEVKDELGVDAKNKVEAVIAIRKAGRMP